MLPLLSSPSPLGRIGWMLLLMVCLAAPSAGKTALQFLQESPKPKFRPGHTLPPLTRWGWTMPFEVTVELTERWGYALEFGGYATWSYVNQLDNTNSIPSRLCALTASNPQKYPLFVLTDRPCFNSTFVNSLPPETWCHDANGNLFTNAPQWQTWSPEMPDSVYQLAGEGTAGPLRKILEKCPISIILNGGEYGLTVYGHAGWVWQQDPTVVAAKGTNDWYDYISRRKAHLEQFVTDAVRAQAPNRTLYLFYYTDGAPDRMAYSSWWEWVFDYRYMRTVSDIANSSRYYRDFNTGWTGSRDMLSTCLNSIAQQIALGDPLSYNWVCGGYKPNQFSDAEHYLGFLKCYYTAGMIGAVAGYFTFPPGGFGADLGNEIPSWLMQMMVLGHAHALFSHLEDYLRNGDLLPGPNMHRWSTDLPAYEFPTGDADARVLVRKHRTRNEWLVTAWAAGGTDREVTVTIPVLGDVTVLARTMGSVYLVTPTTKRLLDPDGMNPTGSMFAPGDVNADFRVTGADSLLINQTLVGLRSNTHPIFATAGFANGDINQTNAVTGADSLLINQTLVGLRPYLVTKSLPAARSNTIPTAVTILGHGFPTNSTPIVTIGPPVDLALTNVAILNPEQITAIAPIGGGLGTGAVNVIYASTNGVISFGRFINQ